MKRCFPIWMLVLSLFGCSAYPAAAEVHDSAVQTLIEEAAENDSEEAAEDPADGTASPVSEEEPGLTDEIVELIEKMDGKYSFKYDPENGIRPGNPETEELMSNLGVLVEVLESEEFQRLMEYPEMQALMRTAFERLVQFVTEEPELATKVLVALGADEKAVQLMMKGVGTAQGMVEAE